jgi:hypothetical protein
LIYAPFLVLDTKEYFHFENSIKERPLCRYLFH